MITIRMPPYGKQKPTVHFPVQLKMKLTKMMQNISSRMGLDSLRKVLICPALMKQFLSFKRVKFYMPPVRQRMPEELLFLVLKCPKIHNEWHGQEKELMAS